MTDPTTPSPLSPAVQARKTEMLAQLQSAMARRVARRRHLRAAGSIAACTLAVAAAWGAVMLSRTPAPAPSPPIARITPEANPSDLPALQHVHLVNFAAKPIAVVVQTDPARMEQLVASPTPQPAAEFLSDEQLLDQLRRTGNTYGLVRSGDHVSVTCYSCPAPAPADAPQRPARPD